MQPRVWPISRPAAPKRRNSTTSNREDGQTASISIALPLDRAPVVRLSRTEDLVVTHFRTPRGCGASSRTAPTRLTSRIVTVHPRRRNAADDARDSRRTKSGPINHRMFGIMQKRINPHIGMWRITWTHLEISTKKVVRGVSRCEASQGRDDEMVRLIKTLLKTN